MAFQRFSLEGFQSAYDIRRQIEIYNGRYLVWAILYEGTHIRRKVAELSTRAELVEGLAEAKARGWELRNQLISQHGLEEGAPLLSSRSR